MSKQGGKEICDIPWASNNVVCVHRNVSLKVRLWVLMRDLTLTHLSADISLIS